MSTRLAEVGEVTIDNVALYLASHARSVARALAENELELFIDLVLLAEHEPRSSTGRRTDMCLDNYRTSRI